LPPERPGEVVVYFHVFGGLDRMAAPWLLAGSKKDHHCQGADDCQQGQKDRQLRLLYRVHTGTPPLPDLDIRRAKGEYWRSVNYVTEGPEGRILWPADALGPVPEG
jgi:hypothetical protein